MTGGTFALIIRPDNKHHMHFSNFFQGDFLPVTYFDCFQILYGFYKKKTFLKTTAAGTSETKLTQSRPKHSVKVVQCHNAMIQIVVHMVKIYCRYRMYR